MTGYVRFVRRQRAISNQKSRIGSKRIAKTTKPLDNQGVLSMVPSAVVPFTFKSASGSTTFGNVRVNL